MYPSARQPSCHCVRGPVAQLVMEHLQNPDVKVELIEHLQNIIETLVAQLVSGDIYLACEAAAVGTFV